MRYVVLVSAVLMQMCLGATYSWSVYVQPLKALTGLQQGPVQVPFTVFYFVFPLSMLITGNLLHKIGTRRSAMIGGILFGGGWVLASLGDISFLYTVLGIGVLAGMGAGMAYVIPIAVCIRWFPQNKGLVTGIAVAGFGGGAALVSQVGDWCMNGLGFTPFTVFLLLGGVFMLMVFGAGSTMVSPKDQKRAHRPRHISPRHLLGNPTFAVLYIAMFTGLAAGFAVNANLKEMFTGPGDAVRTGVLAVSFFALANAFGRVVWGSIFDKITSNTAIQCNLLLQALVLVLAIFLTESPMGFYLFALLTGFNYGGMLVIYVSSATRLWGSENVGQVYGWLFSSNIPASLSPIVAGMIYDSHQSFHLVYIGLASLLLVCGLFVGTVKGRVNHSAHATL